MSKQTEWFVSYQYKSEVGEGFGRAHQGVSRAALRLLPDESDACISHGALHQVGFVSDDRINVFGGGYLSGRGNHMRQKRLSAHFMQHFGMLRLQACAFACGHDGYGHARRPRSNDCFLFRHAESI